jgi:hypothetical protein
VLVVPNKVPTRKVPEVQVLAKNEGVHRSGCGNDRGRLRECAGAKSRNGSANSRRKPVAILSRQVPGVPEINVPAHGIQKVQTLGHLVVLGAVFFSVSMLG